EYEGRFTTVAPALAARYKVALGKSSVVPSVGLRYYNHSRFASESAPHAGLIFKWRDYTAFAAYSRGISYPGVYSLGVASSTVDSLEAEVLDHVEAGVNASWGAGLRLQASVFNDRADNLMQWTPAGLVNVREYEVTGFEISAAIDMRRGISLYAALTLLDPAMEKTPRSPEFSGSAGANFEPMTWLRLTLDLEYVARQYAYNARSGEGELLDMEMLPGYFVANAGVGFPLADFTGAPIELSLEIENLTDEDYCFQPGYPMPGRTVFLTARMETQ
ncbi:MAG: TonB-dependent receptor, partial [bacterium]